MKAGWKVKQLGDVAEIFSGNSIPERDRQGKYSAKSNIGRNFISTKDVGVDGHINLNTDVVIPDNAASDFRLAAEGSTLVCAEGGSAGRKVGFLSQDAHFGNKLFAIKGASSLLHPRFLFYFHNTPEFSQQFRDRLTGLIGGVSLHKYRTIEMPLPPLEEQRRIVSILDEAFEGLSRARANAEANLQSARELFQVLLSEHTNRQEYPSCLLNEVCDVRDGTHDTPKYVEDGVPLVTQKNIRTDGLSLRDVKFISQDDHLAIHKRSNVGPGDILISMIGANRGMSCIVDTDIPFSIKNVGLIKTTTAMNMNFLLLYLQSADAQVYVSEATNGGAQPFIGLGKLRAFPIPRPERATQDKIASELIEMKEYLARLSDQYQLKVQDAEDLRQSLLQKAFAGELTVREFA